jgi:hypothetical protein
MTRLTARKTKNTSFISRLFSGLGSKSEAQKTAGAPSRYQAIAIYRGMVACDHAKKFSEHRFLAKDAPTLPLAGCTMGSRCQCRYLKYKDRRGTQRRLVDFGAPARLFTETDRRKDNGRRTTDS